MSESDVYRTDRIGFLARAIRDCDTRIKRYMDSAREDYEHFGMDDPDVTYYVELARGVSQSKRRYLREVRELTA